MDCGSRWLLLPCMLLLGRNRLMAVLLLPPDTLHC
jgi:hypothetical protein